MTISDWFIGTCGGSHIGIYVCSRCGYEILRSSFEKNFVLKSPNLTSALPLPVTVAAAKGQPKDEKSGSRIESSKPFNNNMLKDFTKNAILGKTFHKDSLVQKIVESGKPENQQVKYDISCGKCGNAFGFRTVFPSGNSLFSIKRDSINLTYRTS